MFKNFLSQLTTLQTAGQTSKVQIEKNCKAVFVL